MINGADDKSEVKKKPLFMPIATEYKPNWKSLSFWRNSLIIYIAFAWFGHIFELICVGFLALIGQASVESFNSINAQFVPADPYGLGALAIIWLIYPVAVKLQKSDSFSRLLTTFILGVVICSLVELFCASVIILVTGNNFFWNYSDLPFNFYGQVCLRNSLAFGAAAVLMIYYMFPLLNNSILRKLSNKRLNIIFVAFVISYLIGQSHWFF